VLLLGEVQNGLTDTLGLEMRSQLLMAISTRHTGLELARIVLLHLLAIAIKKYPLHKEEVLMMKMILDGQTKVLS